MESSPAPAATSAEIAQEPPLELPIVSERLHKQKRNVNDDPFIIRDFAYPDTDPLFSGPFGDGETTEEDEDLPEQFKRHSLNSPPHESLETGGFMGAPPWLQFTGREGSDEDMAEMTHDDDEIHGRAIALFDFTPEHENEFALRKGQIIYISSRHGDGWLVAVDTEAQECGLVPEEYVRLFNDDEDELFMVDDYELQVGEDRITHATRTNATDEWEDVPETVVEGGQVDTGSQPAQEKAPGELTAEELQKIMDAAEREMAMMDAMLRES